MNADVLTLLLFCYVIATAAPIRILRRIKQTPMTSKPSTPDVAEALTKLAKLHADGAVSDEDFKALKAKIIAGVVQVLILKRVKTIIALLIRNGRLRNRRLGIRPNLQQWSALLVLSAF